MMTIDLLLKLFPSPLPLFHPLGQKFDQQLTRSGGFVKVAEYLRYWCVAVVLPIGYTKVADIALFSLWWSFAHIKILKIF